MALLIIQTGKNNMILRQKARPILKIDAAVRMLARDMFETMEKAGGIGLAAVQVSQNQQLFVISPEAFTSKYSQINYSLNSQLKNWELPAFINPKIINVSKQTDIFKEGCLSLPEIEGFVQRPKEVNFEAQDMLGDKIVFKAKGLLARVIQHEADHLKGVLIVDKFSKKIDKTKLAPYENKRYWQ